MKFFFYLKVSNILCYYSGYQRSLTCLQTPRIKLEYEDDFAQLLLICCLD